MKKSRRGIHFRVGQIVFICTLVLFTFGWAQAAGNVESDFLTVYPGVLTDMEKEAVAAWDAANKAIDERGPVDIQALVSGTLPEGVPGVGKKIEVTREMLLYNAGKYDPENPVLTDAAYAKKLGYQDIVAYVTFVANDDIIMPKYPARDKLLVSDLNHNITSYKPIYPGDTIYTVITKRYSEDITPPEGSTYRNLCIYSEAALYNQKGEKVQDAIFRVTENLRFLKEGKTAISDGGPMPAWESPNWTKRPVHKYTDADWDRIRKIWAAEKRQGAEPLYWEDVEVGTYTTQTVDGPIMASVTPTEPYGMGIGGSGSLKKQIMDPDTFKTMYQDANGIWLTKDASVYIPPVPDQDTKKEEAPAPVDENTVSDINTADIHRNTETKRATLINFMGRDIAIRNIDNWMGDQGWLYNIRWSIMAPSAMKAADKTVPQSPITERFVHRIPVLAEANRVVDGHPLSGDALIVQAYIERKYVMNNEFYVDLVWWDETIDGYIVEEGGATVRLPSKSEMK